MKRLEVQQVPITGDQTVRFGSQERTENREIAVISAGVGGHWSRFDQLDMTGQELHGPPGFLGRRSKLLLGLMSELTQDVLRKHEGVLVGADTGVENRLANTPRQQAR